MLSEQELAPILARYPAIGPVKESRPLGGAGGFSGARFWQLETSLGLFCLRRWPVEYPQADDLEFIHRVLQHVARGGFTLAAVPVENSAGGTCIAHADYLWEVAPWMPGVADLAQRPTEARLAAAMQCVARFHRAAENFRWVKAVPARPACPSEGSSPAIAKRRSVLRVWMFGRTRQLETAARRGAVWPEMQQQAERLLRLVPKWAPSVAESLACFDRCPVPLQPCIRDVWHDHLLFQGDEVSGLIDFGSMGVDNVACDVARLLGSLAAGRSDRWRSGLDAYQRLRGLSEVETGLVYALDRSGVFLGALNWAAWTLLEGRVFEEPRAVLQRMNALLERLETETPATPAEGTLLL